MKIPVMLEITPNLKIPVVYRQCARCEQLIGPFTALDLRQCAETSYGQLCRSTLDHKRQAAAEVTA